MNHSTDVTRGYHTISFTVVAIVLYWYNLPHWQYTVTADGLNSIFVLVLYVLYILLREQ